MLVLEAIATSNGVVREVGACCVTVQNQLLPLLQGDSTSCPGHRTCTSSLPRDKTLVTGLVLASGTWADVTGTISNSKLWVHFVYLAQSLVSAFHHGNQMSGRGLVLLPGFWNEKVHGAEPQPPAGPHPWGMWARKKCFFSKPMIYIFFVITIKPMNTTRLSEKVTFQWRTEREMIKVSPEKWYHSLKPLIYAVISTIPFWKPSIWAASQQLLRQGPARVHSHTGTTPLHPGQPHILSLWTRSNSSRSPTVKPALITWGVGSSPATEGKCDQVCSWIFPSPLISYLSPKSCSEPVTQGRTIIIITSCLQMRSLRLRAEQLPENHAEDEHWWCAPGFSESGNDITLPELVHILFVWVCVCVCVNLYIFDWSSLHRVK